MAPWHYPPHRIPLPRPTQWTIWRHRRNALLTRFDLMATGDSGMSTAEYAVGTIAAAAFAAVLYAVVTGDSVLSGLTGLIEQALSGPQ